MFVGRPPGNYDRLLDFSRAVTGNLFFVPSATFLENVAEDQTTTTTPNEDQTHEGQAGVSASNAATAAVEPEPDRDQDQSKPSVREGSLGIGSLKGDIRDE